MVHVCRIHTSHVGIRQRCVFFFSLDLFNLYNESILRDGQDLSGFITSRYNFSNIMLDAFIKSFHREKMRAIFFLY